VATIPLLRFTALTFVVLRSFDHDHVGSCRMMERRSPLNRGILPRKKLSY
jgi:hypothetical protein